MKRPWFVFYATNTFLARGDNEDEAFRSFLAYAYPDHGRSIGRIVPPARHEVLIRPPRSEDREWIEACGNGAEPFIEALNEAAS